MSQCLEVGQSVWVCCFSLAARFLLADEFVSLFSISVAEVEFRDFVSILSVVKPSQVTDTSNGIVTR